MIAPVAYIVLLIVGLSTGELRWMHVARFVLLAIIGLVAIATFDLQPYLYIVVLAVLDIILILTIFKGDIPIQ